MQVVLEDSILFLLHLGGMDPFVFCLINNLGDTISIIYNVDGTQLIRPFVYDYIVKVTTIQFVKIDYRNTSDC